jgi:hypothetical protein
VAIFPQHTSRNGDPQLHVHILWLNKVKTVRHGRWRSIDSRGLYRNKGAGSALAAFALETGLGRRFGFEWAYRPASKGRVIAGFPEAAIARFSSRRAQISKVTIALAEQYEKRRGHAPDQRALWSMRQFANARTRRVKEAGPLDFAGLLSEWEHSSRGAELGTLRQLAQSIWGTAPSERAGASTYARTRATGRADAKARTDLARMREELARRWDLTHTQEHAAMAAGLTQAQEDKAAWSRADLIHCIGQQLPDQAIGRDQAHAWHYLEQLTDRPSPVKPEKRCCGWTRRIGLARRRRCADARPPSTADRSAETGKTITRRHAALVIARLGEIHQQAAPEPEPEPEAGA